MTQCGSNILDCGSNRTGRLFFVKQLHSAFMWCCFTFLFGKAVERYLRVCMVLSVLCFLCVIPSFQSGCRRSELFLFGKLLDFIFACSLTVFYLWTDNLKSVRPKMKHCTFLALRRLISLTSCTQCSVSVFRCSYPK